MPRGKFQCLLPGTTLRVALALTTLLLQPAGAWQAAAADASPNRSQAKSEAAEPPVPSLRPVEPTDIAGLTGCDASCGPHEGAACEDCTDPCGCCCGASWLLSLDAVFLRRSDADDRTLITDQGQAVELLNVTGLNFDHELAPRISLIRQRRCANDPCLDCCLDWEITYFGLDSWSSSATPQPLTSAVAIGPGGLALPSSAPGAPISASYGTDLDSIEFNLRRNVNDCLTLLAGLRWIELGDDLSLDDLSAQENLYNVDTNNHLYGFQLGADASIWRCGCRFYLDSFLRAGIYYNRADQSTSVPALTALAPNFIDRISDQDDHTAFVGEVGLRGVYRLTDGLALRGGYQVMWIEGVALAPDQLPATNMLAPGSAVLDTSGSLFFHGALVGVEATW